MKISLEDIDELRRRAGVSYCRARQVLDQAGGDLLEALILLEETGERPLQVISNRGKDIFAWARRLARGLHQSRVKIEVKGDTVMEFPASLGTAGIVLFPKLAALGLVGVMLARGGLQIEGKPASAKEDRFQEARGQRQEAGKP